MKKFATSCFFVFCFFAFGFSQPAFIPHNVTRGSSPRNISLVDLDNDSDLDILVAYHSDNLLAWHRNDGSGFFDTLFVIDDFNEGIHGLFVLDIDLDGLSDIVTGGEKMVCWYKNLGNGNFSIPDIISTNVDRVIYVLAKDVDNDNLPDVVSASWFDNKTAWYKNLGNGNFSNQKILSTNTLGASGVWAADLNNDALVDIISASYSDNKIAWYQNLGGGTFANQQVISNSANGAFAVMVADFNGDAKPDIVSSQASGGLSDNFSVRYNLGNGNFASLVVINDSLKIPRYFTPADIDNDNDLDIVMAGWYNDSLIWQENLGNGIWGIQHLISDSIEGPYGVASGDLDNDGYLDVVAGSELMSSIKVFLNRGNGEFDENQSISFAAVDVRGIAVADLNNDGQKDIISASKGDNKVVWYKNQGNQLFDLQSLIYDSLNGAWPVCAEDLNLDGFVDVAAAGWDDSLAWFPNLQADSFDIPHFFQGTFGNSKLISAKDINADGLPDIIASANDQIFWSKNLGNGNFATLQFLVSLPTLNSFDLNIINNDSFPDIVFCNGLNMSVAMNNGSGGFLAPQIVNSALGAMDVELSDLNNDGLNDILFVAVDYSTFIKKVGWYPNNGMGNFDPPVIFANVDGFSYTINTSDIDNDGDLDVFIAPGGASYSNENLAFIENLGNATFALPINFDFNLGTIWQIIVSDIDNDNDDDLILSESHLHTVKWLENTLNNLIDTVSICANDSAFIFGNWVSQPGDYTDTLTNTNGGDSVIIVRLETTPVYYILDSVEICQGESFSFNGQILNSSGLYNAVFQSVLGCDSIVQLPLVVHPLPTINLQAFNPASVSTEGNILPFPPASPEGGVFSGAGTTSYGFDPTLTVPGDYWIFYAYTDTITGCSNIDSTLIHVYDPVGIEEAEHDVIDLFPNPASGYFYLTGKNIRKITIISLTGSIVRIIENNNSSPVRINLSDQPKGVYLVQISSNRFNLIKSLILL